MRLGNTLAVAAAASVAVLATDLVFQTSVHRMLFPRILSPPPGAVLRAPVLLEWEGPAALPVTIVRDGKRVALGWQSSPVRLGADHLEDPGEYSVELASPLHESWVVARRAFTLMWSREDPALDRAAETDPTVLALRKEIEDLQQKQQLTLSENASLYEENAFLRESKAALINENETLKVQQAEMDEEIDSLIVEQDELTRQRDVLVQQNRMLQEQLASIPPCLTWGYLTIPRPQTIPRERRIVVVSNSRAEVFRDQIHCERTRRNDPTAASPCVCVGAP